MEIYVKKFFYFIFSLCFLVYKHDFIRCVDVTRIVLHTQQVMTSQISSHRLIIFVCSFYSQNWWKI